MDPSEIYTLREPITVHAVQLTEDADWKAIAEWCGGELHTERDVSDEYDTRLVLPDASGAWLNEWVIRGITGEFFVRDAEQFDATYVRDET